MGKSITKLVIVILIIALGASVAMFGMDFNIGGWHVSYPSALDEDYGIRQGLDLVGGSSILYEADTDAATDSEMESVVNVLRKRLDGDGYTEATVSRQGDKKVRVEIPAIQDPQAALQKMGQPAKLTFRDADGNVVLEGIDVESAMANYGQTSELGANQHYVELKLRDSGVQKFTEATKAAAARKSENKNYISIMLDEQVIEEPRVDNAITAATCIISGGFTDNSETHELANLINSGHLPFSIKVIELRNVGPTLGERALETSLFAAGIGILLIMLFMILMYRLPGLLADVSLLAYIGIVALLLSVFHINLSLPGIAGIILSVGMAVDANVIIFARMKEELAIGRTLKAAVSAGFDRAFIAILDANVTTLIAAVVLYYFGTGSIQGFAITLGIGTVVSMFTAIVVTKFLLRQMVNMKITNTWLYGISKRKEA